ncbi:hypothetical protein Tco_0696469 [Tanacetum coccineum]
MVVDEAACKRRLIRTGDPKCASGSERAFEEAKEKNYGSIPVSYSLLQTIEGVGVLRMLLGVEMWVFPYRARDTWLEISSGIDSAITTTTLVKSIMMNHSGVVGTGDE